MWCLCWCGPCRSSFCLWCRFLLCRSVYESTYFLYCTIYLLYSINSSWVVRYCCDKGSKYAQSSWSGRVIRLNAVFACVSSRAAATLAEASRDFSYSVSEQAFTRWCACCSHHCAYSCIYSCSNIISSAHVLPVSISPSHSYGGYDAAKFESFCVRRRKTRTSFINHCLLN